MESDSGPEGPTQWMAAMYPGFSAQPSNRPPDLQPTGGRAEADLTKMEGGRQRKAVWVGGSREPRKQERKATRSQEAGSSEEAGLREAGRKAR